ncbi:hypothetical protein AYI69_g5710, partial [Smittium culicis]
MHIFWILSGLVFGVSAQIQFDSNSKFVDTNTRLRIPWDKICDILNEEGDKLSIKFNTAIGIYCQLSRTSNKNCDNKKFVDHCDICPYNKPCIFNPDASPETPEDPQRPPEDPPVPPDPPPGPPSPRVPPVQPPGPPSPPAPP